MKIKHAILLLVLLIGCSTEERPSYDIFQNTLPPGGPTLQYSAQGLYGVDELLSPLSEEHAKIFSQSLQWYGTEAESGLNQLHGKTAWQIVEIVNCLKQVTEQEQ